MKGILIFVTFLSLILTILVLVGRGIWQMKKITWANCFYPLNYLGLLIFIFGLFLGERTFWGHSASFITQTGLGLSIFSLFAISSLCIIKTITHKKVKTLLRVPIIGFLLAIYLTPIKFAITIYLLELFVLFLFFKNRTTQLYCYRQQFKAVFGMFLTIFLYYNEIWLFYVGLIIYYVMKFQIANGVRLKLLIIEKSSEI